MTATATTSAAAGGRAGGEAAARGGGGNFGGGGGGGGGGAPGRRRPAAAPPPPPLLSSRLPLLLLLLLALLSSLLASPAAASPETPATCYARCAAEALGGLFSSASATHGGSGSSSSSGGGPVCGSDGRSYANGCLASCAGAATASPGYCEGDRMRFAGAGLPLLPASLLPFERGEAGGEEGRQRAFSGDGGQQQQRRNPTEALAARMALFAEEGFRYVGRTQLAPSVRRQRRIRRQPLRREGGGGAGGGGGGGSLPAPSPSASPSPTSNRQPTSVEVFRATPQGDLYVARYTVPQEEARRAGSASAAALYRPADPSAARAAFLERRRQPGGTDWPVVSAAALVPEMGVVGGGGGRGGDPVALERQLGALMAAPGGNGTTTMAANGGGGASPEDVLSGVKWPVVDVSACLANETAAAAKGGGGNSGDEDDFVASPPPPASRRMLRSNRKDRAFAPIARGTTTTSTRTLSSILGPDERRRCPLSAQPALPESVFESAMARARATLAAGGTVGKPANLTTSSGSFTRGEVAGRAAGDAAATAKGGDGKKNDGLPPHLPPAPAAAFAALWPYSALGQLETRDDAGERVCTGALVGPDTVLTAAHCVWDDATYAFVAAPDFSPGRYRDGCRLVSPWGVVKWRHATIFRAYADTWEQDVAIIKLDAPVGWRTGWLGMRASCGSSVDGGGGGGGGGAGGAGAAAAPPSSSSSSTTTRQTHMSIAGYPLMPTRDGDGECLVASCDVRLREPDAGSGQCPGGEGGGAAAAPAPASNPLTAHSCDTAPGQSGAPLYDSDGYARAIHVLGISVGEPDNGATTLTPWVMANVARWVKGGGGGGGSGGEGVPVGEPMARGADGKGRPPPAAPAGPVPAEIKSLMDTQDTLPLDKPEAWQKNLS